MRGSWRKSSAEHVGSHIRVQDARRESTGWPNARVRLAFTKELIFRGGILMEILDPDPAELFGLAMRLDGRNDGEPLPNAGKHSGPGQLGSNGSSDKRHGPLTL